LSSPSGSPAHRSLRRTILEHLSSVLVVGIVLLVLAVLLTSVEDSTMTRPDAGITRYLAMRDVDWSRPLHREFFRDSYKLLHSATEKAVDSVLRSIEETRIRDLTDPARKLGGERKTLTWDAAGALVPMYGVFILVFLSVLGLTYLAARAMAIRKFILGKQGRSSYLRRYVAEVRSGGVKSVIVRLDLLGGAFLQGLASLVLFSPAYVVAYSLRTRLDTENVFFLILLAVVTNGVLVHYANRLYALLVTESRKGYVETAIVKGVRAGYMWDHREGLPRAVMVTPAQAAEGHVFHEIYRNARLQFIPSMKEHVTFVVTGLVIIEMALNIKGYLCYTLLQHMLFREYDIAIAIVFLIFVAVKVIEACIDSWHAFELRKYSNER
jgi:hypothetical protein